MATMTYKKLDDSVKKSISILKTHVINDCDNKRKFYLPIWKQAGYYWNDIQDIYWDYSTNDWQTFNINAGETEWDSIRDANKIANVYRADGESLIAAATIGNLAIRYYPANANDPRDLMKARAYSDISDYLQIINEIKNLRREALSIRYQFGLTAAYVYYEKDEKYGTVKLKNVDVERTLVVVKECSLCEYTDTIKSKEGIDMNLATMEDYPQTCPQCGEESVNKSDEYTRENIINKGDSDEYRGCSKIELYGPLEVRIPFYAKKPEDIDYVVVQREVHYSTARSMYVDWKLEELDIDDINPNETDVEAYDREQLDFFSSLSSSNLVTITRVWVEPSKYNILTTNSDIRGLMKVYPDGFKATFIGEKLLKCEPEVLKDHWAFCKSPLDSHVYIRPLGQASIPLQDMTNDLIYITMDTIRHSVGDTWVNAKILNRKILEAIKQAPGSYLPIFPDDNKAIGEYFFSSKAATLSREVDNFFARIEGIRQHVGGILPSVFGGRFQGGSQTFGEYKQSRDQALQRISLPADNVDDFLAEAFLLATELYADNMQQDEYYSMAEGNNFINKTLRKPHSKGKISRIEVMKSEQFPLTWEQQRASIVELLSLNKEPIDAAVFSPENIAIANKVVGIAGLKLPGEDDRNKQLIEIHQLLDSASPDGGRTPSVLPDYDIDNDDMHLATIVGFCVSSEGLYQQKVNPSGWANLLLHLQAHKQNKIRHMVEQMTQQPPQPSQTQPPATPPKSNKAGGEGGTTQ